MNRPILIIMFLTCISSITIPSVKAQSVKSKKELRKERREQRRKASKLTFAKYHLILQNGKDSATFEDDNITANFSLGNGIYVVLKNNMDQPIEILWNETSIVMPDGTTKKIMHSGIKYIDRGQNMPNTVIPPGAKINDKLIPIDRVRWNSTFNDWNDMPLFKTNSKTKLALMNKTMSVFMPIKLPSGKKNYNFKFKIDVY